MFWVFDDVSSPLVKSARVNRVQFWKLGPHNPLFRLHHPGQVPAVLCSAAAVPHCGTVAEDVLHCAPVNVR